MKLLATKNQRNILLTPGSRLSVGRGIPLQSEQGERWQETLGGRFSQGQRGPLPAPTNMPRGNGKDLKLGRALMTTSQTLHYNNQPLQPLATSPCDPKLIAKQGGLTLVSCAVQALRPDPPTLAKGDSKNSARPGDGIPPPPDCKFKYVLTRGGGRSSRP